MRKSGPKLQVAPRSRIRRVDRTDDEAGMARVCYRETMYSDGPSNALGILGSPRLPNRFNAQTSATLHASLRGAGGRGQDPLSARASKPCVPLLREQCTSRS